MTSSLLQGLLRQTASDALDNTKQRSGASPPLDDSSDDELVNVVSLPGTPSRSRAPSRPPSPTGRGAARRLAPGPLLLNSNSKRSTDPLKVLPTEVTQRVFAQLAIRDLARCARVSRKWKKSQTINYVWFQHYRKENFHDESLPPGKWTKRESKQNWSTMYAQIAANRTPPTGSIRPSRSGYSTPGSGYQTPREMREERWKQEAETVEKPGKLEMREMYKELGGRKSKAKAKLGGSGAVRDKGGWTDGMGEDYY
ncbi:hypothetical protein OF83DRAFT_1143167 [Amylostereum chailletii]|nr:hypothetical protein OF83DRAFT_1143167 [Amylostereum chailletii]